MKAGASPVGGAFAGGLVKTLLVGASGQLGQCLQDRRPETWALLAPSSSELDICDRGAVEAYLKREKPGLVVNACAYNAVDRAESEPERAMAVNAEGPCHLARAAARIGARLIHVSTDYVFDGAAAQPYKEDATANPINVYGKSKRAGELAVLSGALLQLRPAAPLGAPSQQDPAQLPGALALQEPAPPLAGLPPPHVIVVRTAWLYSEYSGNFVAGMLRRAAQGKPIYVVDDQTGTPTYAGDLARAIIQLSRQPDAPSGIYHYAGATVLSWHGFAQRIFQAAGLEPQLIPISTRQYAAPAARPKYSALSCEKIALYGLRPEPLQASLARVVEKILVSCPPR